jgi:hypothetical protein
MRRFRVSTVGSGVEFGPFVRLGLGFGVEVERATHEPRGPL